MDWINISVKLFMYFLKKLEPFITILYIRYFLRFIAFETPILTANHVGH